MRARRTCGVPTSAGAGRSTGVNGRKILVELGDNEWGRGVLCRRGSHGATTGATRGRRDAGTPRAPGAGILIRALRDTTSSQTASRTIYRRVAPRLRHRAQPKRGIVGSP